MHACMHAYAIMHMHVHMHTYADACMGQTGRQADGFPGRGLGHTMLTLRCAQAALHLWAAHEVDRGEVN